jgi:antagonist of KipI
MLKVIEPGILTTIQDAGRWGYQAYGVPVSGAMDLFALQVANKLVGNPLNEAALEIHSPVVFESDMPHLLAVTGTDARFEVGGRAMPQWMSIFARAGTMIEIAPRCAGGWAYLAVHGGIDVPRVLDSKSTFLRGKFGGLEGRALAAGDEIPVGAAILTQLVAAAGRRASDRVCALASRPPEIRVVLGPHDDLFTPEAIAALTHAEYAVTDIADRMGYRLRGTSPLRPSPSRRGEGGEVELVSCGMPLGAIQVPPDGQPIVLMADHQTTGGYPIITTVITADIPLVAQRAPGGQLKFKAVKVAEAQSAWCEMWHILANER